MTTMLEKAAAAGCEVTEMFGREEDVVRAILQAIREVDQETYNAGWAAMTGEPDAGPGDPWLAMIDAILEEKA